MTTQELETRHWLNRAFYADKKAKALDMLVRQCRERAEGLSRCSVGNDKGKSDSAENGTENALMKLAEMERKADEQKVEAVETTLPPPNYSLFINTYLVVIRYEQILSFPETTCPNKA